MIFRSPKSTPSAAWPTDTFEFIIITLFVGDEKKEEQGFDHLVMIDFGLSYVSHLDEDKVSAL